MCVMHNLCSSPNTPRRSEEAMLFVAAGVALLVGLVTLFFVMKNKNTVKPALVGGWTPQAQSISEMHAELTNDIRVNARQGGAAAAVVPHNESDDDAEDGSQSNDGEQQEGEGARGGPGRRGQRRVDRNGEAQQAGIDTSGMSKKERLKALKKHDKEGRRAAQDAAAEQRRESEEQREREARERRIREEQQAAQEEAALKALRDEKKRAEDEEYRRWAGDIKVEAKGEAADAKLEDKIKAYLTTGAPHEDNIKVLELEATSRKFGASVERITEILEQLLREKKVIGIFDERGGFFYLKLEELGKLKTFIEQRGRVSLETIADECNRVISV